MPDPVQALLQRIRDNIVGNYAPLQTPFGERPLVYADYTASGRAMLSIEEQLRDAVLPWYANTHSETSFTGAQTTALREQARQIIHRALNGGPEDKIIFCGSGATAAINRLVDILNLRLPRDLDRRYQLSQQIPPAERLPILSLRFSWGGRDLHYGFIVALLNDLFGIQARGGCSCAGPYGHVLLGLTRNISRQLEEGVAAGESALRPGWVRLNFNYFIGEDEFEYLLRALELVAERGWRLLPAYRLDRREGLWRHRDAEAALPVDLHALDPLFAPGAAQRPGPPDFLQLLRQGDAILRDGASATHIAAAATEGVWCEKSERLRWFALPADAAAALSADARQLTLDSSCSGLA